MGEVVLVVGMVAEVLDVLASVLFGFKVFDVFLNESGLGGSLTRIRGQWGW